jgi:malate synthase
MKIATENAPGFGRHQSPGQCAASDRSMAGAITRAGFIGHIDSCVRHLAALLAADKTHAASASSAAAECARVQLWRWLHAGDATLDDGTPIDFNLFDTALQRVGERLPRRGMPGQENLMQAAWLLAELTHSRTLAESLPMGSPARSG